MTVVRALAVTILVGALLVVPGSHASGRTPRCGPFFLVRLPSLGTLTWRTSTKNGRDWHGVGYRPTPPVATTQVDLKVGRRTVARRTVNEDAVRFPLFPKRFQLVTLSQMTEPGTLRASVRVDFKPGAVAPYCEPYFPPGLRITLTPRS
jgi:hypothetical protein